MRPLMLEATLGCNAVCRVYLKAANLTVDRRSSESYARVAYAAENAATLIGLNASAERVTRQNQEKKKVKKQKCSNE